MELLGSIHALSGSMSASVFTGSFKGDASGLYNIPASGVTGLNLSQIATGSVTASVSLDGFNVNSDTSITGSLTISGTVVSQTTTLVSGSPQIDITNATNYTSFSSSIATTDLNQENRLSALETSSGSLNSFTSSIDTTIKNKLNTENVISGSAQILSNSGIVSSSTQVTQYGFATTGSNTFIGTQTLSGSIIPSIDNTYDLGSPTYQWRDVYISSGSLYVDGTKVLSSTAQELLITTDTGQSIKILEGTTDSIVLQTADGDIELKSSADGDILLDPTNGKIMLKGPVEILNGNKIQSSVGGTPVVFANDIVVSGSIDITGTIEGIDLTNFSSSVNTRISNLESSAGSLNSFTSSTNNRLSAIETSTGSLNTFTNSINTTIKSKLDSEGVISGSVQIDITNTTNYTTFSSSISSSIGALSSSVATTTNNLSTSVAIYDLAQDDRLNSIEGKTGSYATTGSNIFIGNQTITGSLYVSQDLVIAGSSSIQHISSSIVNIADNIITVNAQNPSIRFGGLAVIDSGSSPQVSGSMLFDSVTNQWLFVHQNQSTITSSVLLMGPETYNNLGGESYLTQNRLIKGTGIEHLSDSNITDTGTKVSINSNTEITGTFVATGTALVSGSSQINHNATTNYDANQHVDHTTVSITAGSGLSGGGTIAATRTLTLDTGSVHFLDGVKKELNTEGVVSGSSQVSFNGISDKPALVSGSSQITYSGLSGIPSGIVSGSSQITYGSISSIPSGIVSGSAQVDLTSTTNYTSGIKTRLNAEGVLSGSAQVVSVLPSGTVSGSAQITLSSTTGYASYDANVVHISGNETITGIKTFENSSTDQIIIKSTSAAATDVGAVITMQGYDGASNRTFAYISALKENSTSGNYASRLVFYTRANGAGLAEALSLASNKNATFGGSINGLVVSSGTITTGTWNGTAIANAYLANSSFYIGTTSISLGRASASQTLTGVSIDGNAATATSAGNITSYTINQNLGTSNSPTFSGLDLTGRLYLNAGSYEGSILFGSSTTWRCGIRQHDDADAELRIWTVNNNGMIFLANGYNGEPADIARPTDGLVVGPGNNVGIGNFSSSDPGYKLQVNGTGYFSGNLTTAAYVIVGGSYGNNAYNSVGSTRLLFGGGDSDALSNYFIGTNLENYGGNYTKLDLRWHTGIRMGAQPGYGGIRFFNNEDLDSVLFSIGAGDGNVRSHTNLLPSANNSYNLGSASLGWANVYTNDLHLSNMNKPGGNDIDGTNGTWTIQEGEENLYIINNKNGKRFKIDLTEIV